MHVDLVQSRHHHHIIDMLLVLMILLKNCSHGIKQKSLAQEYGTDIQYVAFKMLKKGPHIQYVAFKMLKKGPQLLWN